VLRVTAEDALEWLRSASGELGAAAAAYLEIVSYRLLKRLDTGDPYALEVPQVLVEGIRLAVTDGAPASSDASAQEVERVRDLVPAANRPEFDDLLAEARLTSGVRDERGLYSDVWASGITRRAILAPAIDHRMIQSTAITRHHRQAQTPWSEQSGPCT
jgi:hypothetical protein